MDIPVSVAIANFKRDIVEVINQSRLHPTILQICFKEITAEIDTLAKQTAQQEQQEWETEQSKEKSTPVKETKVTAVDSSK